MSLFDHVVLLTMCSTPVRIAQKNAKEMTGLVSGIVVVAVLHVLLFYDSPSKHAQWIVQHLLKVQL